MNTIIKTQWLEALRSGKYKQGVNCLRSIDDKYCCLGVLCDLVDNSRWTTQPRALHWHAAIMGPDGEVDRYAYSGETTEPSGGIPGELAKKCDIPSNIQTKLIDMNDISRCTFSEIADWVEANL